MCEITITKYVQPDGRRQSVERKRLCSRSDGVNPCILQTRKEITEFVPPSLVNDNGPSPASSSMPSTPIPATAANYEVRTPYQYSSSSKAKGKAKSYGLSVNVSGNRKKSSKPRSGERSRDDDEIVAIEENGRIRPVSPNTHHPSLGSPFSRRRPQVSINQAQPPLHQFQDPMRPSTTGSYHRRTSTEPEPISFGAPEIFDRANARDELRRQNRERQHRLDAEKQQREEADRKLAEDLQRQELREKRERAEDEFSMNEYRRMQEKDRLREEARRQREQDEDERAQVDRIAKEIKERKEKEAKRRKAMEELRRQQEALDRARQQKEQEKMEELLLHENLERRRREREQTTVMQMREIDEEIARLDRELLLTQERRAARERAERLERDVRQHDALQEEIRRLEQETRATLPPNYEDELFGLEEELQRLNSRIRPRDMDYDSFSERRKIGPASPRTPTRSPVEVLQRLSPYQNEEYRRFVGAQVLEQERNNAWARSSLDTPGLSRRNTIGGGNRSREQHYRDMMRRYPG